MIRIVTVCAGDDTFARAAQQYALTLAKAFGARLCGVLVWEPEDVEKAREGGYGDDLEQLAQREVKELIDEARAAGLEAEARFRGEGLRKSLLAEGRESDLLVVGMPTEGVSRENRLARALLHAELPLLRKGEASLLVCCRPPASVDTVLVSYQGGVEGKAALRLGAHVAERMKANVAVLSIQGDLAQAELLAATAEQYLRAFELPAVETIERAGSPESEGEVLQAVDDAGADLIVFGDEPYGVLERFFGGATAEKVALATETPVLIAR
ncbi:MAG: universal stress protein [bacterium]